MAGSQEKFTSTSLIVAILLMPAGFFLGGLIIYASDPGLGILLVPLGGAFLFVAVLMTSLGLKYFESSGDPF